MNDHAPSPTSRRVVMGFGDAANLPRMMSCPGIHAAHMGPPTSMHGTVRMVLEVEGEKVRTVDVQIGFLHRCFEKEAENATWTQIFPTPTASTTCRPCCAT